MLFVKSNWASNPPGVSEPKDPPMKSVIIKRSIVLNGHKTSVSLENEFWEGLRQIADAQKSKVSAMVQRIDRERTNRNLSSAIRIYVFNHFRERLANERASAGASPAWAPTASYVR
jgi:predicted DNA-binding ribbon-helix-helix protein